MLGRFPYQVGDLYGEVGRHEADGQEEDGQLGEQRGGSVDRRSRLGVLLRQEVEVRVRKRRILREVIVDGVEHKQLKAVIEAAEAVVGLPREPDAPEGVHEQVGVGARHALLPVVAVHGQLYDVLNELLVALEELLELAQVPAPRVEGLDDAGCVLLLVLPVLWRVSVGTQRLCVSQERLTVIPRISLVYQRICQYYLDKMNRLSGAWVILLPVRSR